MNSVLGYGNRRGSNSGLYNSRPSPYDRGDRFSNSNRFQSRGSRNFKGVSNSTDYNYDNKNSTNWTGSNGSDSRGGRSPYEIDSWGEGNQGADRIMHCVHMRGLPFKATAADITDVI